MKMRCPRYVHGYIDRHGRPRYYLRKPGVKPVALPDRPWTLEFMAAYEAAADGKEFLRIEVGERCTRPGSVNAVIVAYYNSLAFRALALATQKMRRAILENFRVEHGDKRIALMLRLHIEKLLSGKTPAAARNWLKTIRGLIQFAVANGFREDDPTSGIKLPRHKSNGFHTWNEGEIEQFEAKYPIGSKPRLALGLLLYTAQRRGDVIRMGRQHIRNGMLQLRQDKTGTTLQIPVHSALGVLLDASPSGHLTLLTTEYGKPFTAAGFGNWFREVCDKANLPKECSAHGLRKAACRRLAEAGCTVKQIAAISGHRSLSEVQHYTDATDQARLARDAMRTLEAKVEHPLANRNAGSPK